MVWVLVTSCVECWPTYRVPILSDRRWPKPVLWARLWLLVIISGSEKYSTKPIWNLNHRSLIWTDTPVMVLPNRLQDAYRYRSKRFRCPETVKIMEKFSISFGPNCQKTSDSIWLIPGRQRSVVAGNGFESKNKNRKEFIIKECLHCLCCYHLALIS